MAAAGSVVVTMVGLDVGSVGLDVGLGVGKSGLKEGVAVGLALGLKLGLGVGLAVGCFGAAVILSEGDTVGWAVVVVDV